MCGSSPTTIHLATERNDGTCVLLTGTAHQAAAGVLDLGAAKVMYDSLRVLVSEEFTGVLVGYPKTAYLAAASRRNLVLTGTDG
jgi:hypothetical protein